MCGRMCGRSAARSEERKGLLWRDASVDLLFLWRGGGGGCHALGEEGVTLVAARS
jgi:hypothetical protein